MCRHRSAGDHRVGDGEEAAVAAAAEDRVVVVVAAAFAGNADAVHGEGHAAWMVK